jgi:hypothetical protein
MTSILLQSYGGGMNDAASAFLFFVVLAFIVLAIVILVKFMALCKGVASMRDEIRSINRILKAKRNEEMRDREQNAVPMQYQDKI